MNNFKQLLAHIMQPTRLLHISIGYIVCMSVFGLSISVYESTLGLIHKNTSPQSIWTYQEIKPKEQFYVGQPLKFLTSRTSNLGTFDISFNELLRCDFEQRVMANIISRPFPFIEGETKDKEYTYGEWANGEFYPFIPKESGVGCNLTSQQTLDYYGFKKSQTYKSNYFDILQ